jgi:hypothetical protein
MKPNGAGQLMDVIWDLSRDSPDFFVNGEQIGDTPHKL